MDYIPLGNSGMKVLGTLTFAGTNGFEVLGSSIGGGASRVHLTGQLEGSLKRLKTDYLDLYFVHQWDGVTPIEETIETMSGFVKAGKIRYWGISNYSGWALAKTAMVAQTPGFIPPVAHQIYYTPEAREAE